MSHDTHDGGLSPAADFAVDSLDKVQSASPKLPSPALISETVTPKVIVVEGRKWVRGISDETASGMSVKTEQERNKQVMGIPESLEGLLPNLSMCGRVNKQHTKKHYVACDSSGFCVMDLDSSDRTNLCLLDIEEANKLVEA